MHFDELLDVLDDLLDRGWTLPMSGGKTVVDAEEIRGIIRELRLNLPQELRKAKSIIAERDEIMLTVSRERELVMKSAEEKQKHMLSDSEILRQAQAKADEILNEAQTKVREIRASARQYAEEMLKQVDDELVNLLSEVRKARQGMKK